jgi:hypothetical protein
MMYSGKNEGELYHVGVDLISNTSHGIMTAVQLRGRIHIPAGICTNRRDEALKASTCIDYADGYSNRSLWGPTRAEMQQPCRKVRLAND